ncbi:hypothetical protein LCGC14_2307300, partial [marine sediment metagenome]
MAESLNAEQIEERRTNLHGFRHSIGMVDDSELTTTLLMQEEWLATVDELEGYARDAHIIRGLRTRKCLLRGFLNEMGEGENDCTDYWKDKRLYCGPCYLRAIHEPKDLPATSVAPVPESLTEWPTMPVLDEDEEEDADWGPEEMWREQFEPPTECETIGQAHVWVKVGTVGA